MAINPLTKRPQPPDGVPHRAMFFWSSAVGSADPLDKDSAVNTLISFLDELNVGCNTIFLDVWRYLGGSNWTNAHRDRLYAVLDGLKRSGCRVYALAGNVDWGMKHKWVMDNIVEPVLAFNAIATSPSQQFDGIILDVEYWTDETNFPAFTNCPGLCDLVKAIKARAPQLGVGLFLAFFLKDNTATRATLTYAGKTAQDGEHFMDVVDFIVVRAYRDHAADGGAEGGPGQISLFQPWYDYASGQGKKCGLYCGSETSNVSPSYMTYRRVESDDGDRARCNRYPVRCF